MAGSEIEIVSRTIKISGHRRDEVATIFAPISLAKLEPGDFGNGVPLIGGLKGPGEQRIFFDRLRRELWVDAGGAEKQQLFNVCRLGSMNHIRCDGEIVVQALRRPPVISPDPANLSRRQKHG